jgi:phosphocarrier protein HPr
LKKVTAVVSDPVGFHLRAAGRIVKVAKQFSAEVMVTYNGRVANAKSIMGLASLAAGFGCSVELEADGPDATEALESLVKLIEVDLAEAESADGNN